MFSECFYVSDAGQFGSSSELGLRLENMENSKGIAGINYNET